MVDWSNVVGMKPEDGFPEAALLKFVCGRKKALNPRTDGCGACIVAGAARALGIAVPLVIRSDKPQWRGCQSIRQGSLNIAIINNYQPLAIPENLHISCV